MQSPSIVPAAPSLNALAAEIHAANAHWWHDPATGERLNLDRGERYMLMVSEVAEAMEGERKSLRDDKLPHRPMAEVEIADVMIRVLDYAGAYALDLDYWFGVVGLDPMPANKGGALFQIVSELCGGGRERRPSYRRTVWPDPSAETRSLCRVIAMCRRYCLAHGYDLDGAIAEKRAYNAVRPDHKAEARLAANGKKF